MKKRILIVEDDTSIRTNLLVLLESEGYQVEAAIDGRDALDKLKAASLLPSLIMLDLMMPRMDGFQFREEQRADPRLAYIPVVIISADGKVEEKQKKIGAQAYLRKPLDLDEILNVVAGLLP